MSRFSRGSVWLTLLFAVAGLGLIGCAGGAKYTPDNAPAMFECVPAGKLEKSIEPEAELEDFSCSFNKWEGVDTLHFSVGIKNVSDQDQRYRVNIFLDNGKAVGGLIPRKTKNGLVKPGTSASFTYPVKNQTESPRSVILNISTVSQ